MSTLSAGWLTRRRPVALPCGAARRAAAGAHAATCARRGQWVALLEAARDLAWLGCELRVTQEVAWLPLAALGRVGRRLPRSAFARPSSAGQGRRARQARTWLARVRVARVGAG